jgi:hypothetical protein
MILLSANAFAAAMAYNTVKAPNAAFSVVMQKRYFHSLIL